MKQRGTTWYTSRRLIVASSAVALVGLVSAAVLLSGNGPGRDNGDGVTTAPAKSLTAPGKPPVAICGNAKALNGPATAPSGAVPVSTTQNLQDLTAQHPAGTTFYLAAGTHRLAGGEFLQVIPKDGNRYIGAPGAILDGAKSNRYAFTGYAPNVQISHLTIQNFGAAKGNNDEGVVNHDSATGWTIEANTIMNNAGAGLMIGSRNIVRGNCLRDNGQYGFNAYNPNGVNGITVERNEITGNNTDDWENLAPGLRLYRWRQVLDGDRRRDARQLDARQPRPGAVGRHEQRRRSRSRTTTSPATTPRA